MSATICQKLLDHRDRPEDQIAVIFRDGSDWKNLSWRQYHDQIEQLAAGLFSQGLRPGDRILIYAETQLEWAIIDLAALCLGAITVPVYPFAAADEIEFIYKQTAPRFVATDSETPPEIFPPDKIIRMTNANSTADLSIEKLKLEGNLHLQNEPHLLRNQIRDRELTEVASIVYTSGTSGQVKGAVLTHEQILSEVKDSLPILGISGTDTSLSFLPFAHILGRIEIWGHLLLGYTMAYAQSTQTLKADMAHIQPTVILGVPSIFEKIYQGVHLHARLRAYRHRLLEWALDIGRKVREFESRHEPVPIPLALQFRSAHALVFHPILERFGGKLRFAISGGAALNSKVAEFFAIMGLPIYEGYGLTETTGAICVNTPFAHKLGTVGKPIGDVEIKLASDGEILVKSRKVMKEYFLDPDETAQSFENGFFKTGDLGAWDEEGYLMIVGRKKDLIKTSTGKYVAPQRIERLLKDFDLVSNIHVYGDNRKYIVALITLHPKALKRFARENDLPIQNLRKLHDHPTVRRHIRDLIARVNNELAHHETIKNFQILDHDFSIESGELTPSLKVKRQVLDRKYASVLEDLYRLPSDVSL